MSFEKVSDAEFLRGEHEMLAFWKERAIFDRLREQNRDGEPWSFLDGPITANNPMGVHHAWGRTYKDAFQRFHAMRGHALRYQNGFDCQGLWVEVEVQKELGLNTTDDVERFGIDRFVNECKRRVLRFAARQTEQSIRLGYWMDWDDPDELRKLAEALGGDGESGDQETGSDGETQRDPEDASSSVPLSLGRVCYRAASGKVVEDVPHRIVEQLGNRDWGGSYFTFSTRNNETIWTFLKKCFSRGKVYRGHDVMPWSGLAGSAYSQMEVADGRRLTTHRSVFVRFPIVTKGEQESGVRSQDRSAATERSAESALGSSPLSPGREAGGEGRASTPLAPAPAPNTAKQERTQSTTEAAGQPLTPDPSPQGEGDRRASAPLTAHHSLTTNEYLLVWTTTPWTLTSNVAAAVNPDLDYVKLQSNRDGAIYYFAKDNLEFKRLEREFKEGFGRPEWGWPDGVPKLKTLAQIFKEQGGYEILETVKGSEMIGWRYTGPFDELDAQNVKGGIPEDKTTPLAGIDCHRVIDGGRDSKGNPNVTAGEGTGIVHIAPGCGDVDHKLGQEHGIVSIAPLAADGTFVEGFGEFTGLKATSPEVPELVLTRLKEKGFHVADEVYPHIYPFCWRTGDELVFRLVDEWFINMDWREEIKDVVRAIRWLPPSMQGEERELEWLTTMRDWMISKKRYWGLALPIWVDEATGDFEVIGSLAELKERAVEGWSDFSGKTPHRPWIDQVKIRNEKTGNLMSRVPDVGNPWLDAGIVAFSTMGYPLEEAFSCDQQERSRSPLNGDHAYWEKWYPADLILECFPGQFRNWFYSLLSMSTMMRHGETDDPREKRPFKTLFGHRLVMNEDGEPMHKSDGTAIWFEEAAEQLGVDTLRWMYLAQNPSADLRFGTRHPDQPVTLRTPEGDVSATKEGFKTCLVTSKPADEVRRQVLIPLWNSYAFFVNYARLDGFDPNAECVPYEERPEIDRWILSNLQSVIETSEDAWPNCDAATACAAAAEFIDDLSNWYIRRNRRRFWRGGSLSRSQGSGLDIDKLSAYQTLYEVLVTLTKLLAPVIPFLTERMYQNLVKERGTGNGEREGQAPDSVHLCRFPSVNAALKDPALSARTALAQRVVAMGHKLREEAGHRVRQPLAELRFAAPTEHAEALERLADVIREELNVKAIVRAEHLDELVSYTYKPNLKTLGPKHGKRLAAIRKELPDLGDALLAPLRRGENVTVTIGGEPLELSPEDVMVGTSQAADWVTASDGGIQIALSTKLTPDLIREGLARDFVRQIQQLRKDAGLEIEDRITIAYATEDSEAAAAIETWGDFIAGETLADRLHQSETISDGQSARVGNAKVKVKIDRV